MKLLFDQNLSPRLPRLLADIYTESLHVRSVGMQNAPDLDVWQYAKAHGYTIVSKDSDFQQRSLFAWESTKIYLVACWQLFGGKY